MDDRTTFEITLPSELRQVRIVTTSVAGMLTEERHAAMRKMLEALGPKLADLADAADRYFRETRDRRCKAQHASFKSNLTPRKTKPKTSPVARLRRK